MSTQVTNSNQWYAHRSPLGQTQALAAILERDGIRSIQTQPTLKYIWENFTNADRTNCDNIAKELIVPEKFRHIAIIPRRRVLKKPYRTIGRVSAKVALFRFRQDIPKEVCQRFRSGWRSLGTTLEKSGVRFENHLIAGAHGEEDNRYAVNEHELYQRMSSDPRTESALDQLKKVQPKGDFIVFPLYIPDEPQAISAQSVRAGLSRGEFGLTSWMLEYALCAQIGDSDLREEGPFSPDKNDIEVSCPGDAYTLPDPKGKKDCVTIFSWKNSTLQIDLLPANTILQQRPAIGFVPTEFKPR